MDRELPVLTGRTGFLLSRVGTAIQAQFKETLARWEIKPLHFLLLTTLTSNNGASQQDLCRALSIDSGNMVELIDRLEELRLAKRAPDPRDRRRHLVTVTAKGRRTLDAIRSAVAAFEQDFFAPLKDAERTQLAKTLGKLYATTAEARGEAPPLGTAAPSGRR